MSMFIINIVWTTKRTHFTYTEQLQILLLSCTKTNPRNNRLYKLLVNRSNIRQQFWWFTACAAFIRTNYYADCRPRKELGTSIPNRNHLNTIRRHIGIYRAVIHTSPGDILCDACMSNVCNRLMGMQMKCLLPWYVIWSSYQPKL